MTVSPTARLDEVVVQLTRLAQSDSSVAKLDKQLQPAAPLVLTLMTARSREAALEAATGEGRPIGLIAYGSRSGRYRFDELFPEADHGVADSESNGVFRMQTWVCPPDGNSSRCAAAAENEIKRPDPNGPDSRRELIFTVCPSHASISLETAPTSALSLCKCDPGYTGPDGKTCTACECATACPMHFFEPGGATVLGSNALTPPSLQSSVKQLFLSLSFAAFHSADCVVSSAFS